MKKGFAISGLVYSILVLFLILIFGIIGILGSRKLILDKMKNNLMGELNEELINNIYTDDSGANYPRLVNKMIPIIYDEAKENWVYANIYEKWYDYDEKMWANAVVLKNGVIKTVGQEIKEEEIALMYVWIPRFKYVMFNANNEEVDEQQIDVIFEKNTNSTGTIKCVDAINQTDSNGNLISEMCTDITNTTIVNNASTYTHPAFTFGDDEIEGFWVGKFENSTTDEFCLTEANADNCNKSGHIIEIKPNSDALRNINISNMFTSIQNISNNYGITDADSHMIKNMEWGAIAYLTQSKYGRCTNGICEEVTINNILNNEYNTLKGVKTSTTSNIYGVYDMAGGSNEYVMANMVDNLGFFNPYFSDLKLEFDTRYLDLYTYGADYLNFTRGKFGDGTKEIINKFNEHNGGWYNGYSGFIDSTSPWLVRGGEDAYLSIFSFNRNDGQDSYSISSRTILIKE